MAALAVALVWSAFLARAHVEAQASVLDRLESSFADLRFLAAGRRPSPPDVMIVAVDDATARLAKTLPLPRPLLAGLVQQLFTMGAKVVALDFLFFDAGIPNDNDRLAQALRAGPTVSASAISFARAEPDATAPAASTIDCGLPVPALRSATSVGFVNMSVDRSGIPRYLPMLLHCGGNIFPAFSLRAASLASGSDPAFETDAVVIGGVATSLDADNNLALRFYGPEAAIETVSAAEILAGRTAPDRIRGRTMVIGTTAKGTGDRYPTPFDSVTPGVEIMATAIGNLETGEALRRTALTRRIDAVIVILLAVAAVFALTMRNIGLGLALVAALLAALVGFTFVSFAYGFWFSLAMPLAGVVPVAVLTGAARLGLDRLSERKMLKQQRALSAFQSPAILARLGADPDFLSRPIERDIAVVFVDLTGFTRLSERLGPQATRDLLKEFHDLVEDEVSRGGGIVATYMADGAMLIWGLADQAPDDALRAVRTAISLQARALAWLRTKAGYDLGIKFGGHLGPAILSRLGHATHQHITAIGDTVNIAARLMQVAAWNGSTMALSTQLIETAKRQGDFVEDGGFTPPRLSAIHGRKGSISMRLWAPARADRL
jgi:adenylate cyclase